MPNIGHICTEVFSNCYRGELLMQNMPLYSSDLETWRVKTQILILLFFVCTAIFITIAWVEYSS